MLIGLSVVAGFLLAVLANPLGDLFNQPNVVPILLVLATHVVVQAWIAVPRTLLQRTMRFRALYGIDLVGAATLFLVQVASAFAGLGAWSYVVAQYAQTVLVLFCVYLACHWYPHVQFSTRHLRAQWRFGWRLWSGNLLQYLSKNADYWVVGALMGAIPLGTYYVAYVAPNLLRQRLSWIASEVLLPVYSSLNDDPDRQASIFSRSVRLHGFVGFPIMLGLVFASTPAVEVLFGDQWYAAAAPMRIIALAAAFDFITRPSANLLLALGYPGVVAKLQLTRGIPLAVTLPLTVPVLGLVGAGLSVLVASVATCVHSQLEARRHLQFGFKSLVGVLQVPLVASAAMGIVLSVAEASVVGRLNPVLHLLVLVVSGISAYVGTVWFAERGRTTGVVQDLRLLQPGRRGDSSTQYHGRPPTPQ
jgi:PST family polysaccharide transporter